MRRISMMAMVICLLMLVSTMVSAYGEAPILRERVERGELPPVEERLPAEPFVVEVIEEIGQYGGTWNRAAIGRTDIRGGLPRLVQEMVFMLDHEMNRMSVAIKDYDFEVFDDKTLFRMHLREGMKWSDGAPFTVDDMIFYYEDVVLYSPDPDEPAVPPSWLTYQGDPVEMVKIDDYTLEIWVPGPEPLFMEAFLNPSQGGRRIVNHPKHYLSQFHPLYNPREDMSAEEQWAEFQALNELVGYNPYFHPDRPVIFPWKLESWDGRRHVMVRNPYYFKVDSAGNQLPYIDRLIHEIVEDTETITLKAINGEIDMQMRHLNFADYSLLMANRDAQDYRVFLWENGSTAAPGIFLNQHAKDPVVRELLTTRDFRIALSHAIDREEINELLWYGEAVPHHATVHRESPWYVEGVDQLYIDYDPAKANQLLDDLGFTEYNADGIRLGPDGNPIRLLLDISTPPWANYMETVELVKDYWEDVGVEMLINPVDRGLFHVREESNDQELCVWPFDRVLYSWGEMWLLPTERRVNISNEAGLWYETGGARGTEPEGELRELLDLWTEIRLTVDPEKRQAMVYEMVERTAREAYVIGTVGNEPMPVVVKNNFRNVPEFRLQWDFIPMTPKNSYPEQYFMVQ